MRAPFAVLLLASLPILRVSCKLHLPDPKPEYDDYVSECLAELGIDDKKLRAEDTPKRRCLAKCMATKIGYINDDGDIVMDAFLKTFNPSGDEANVEILRKCAEESSNDTCIKAMMIDNCVVVNSDTNNTVPLKLLKSTVECMKEYHIENPPEVDDEFKAKYKCYAKCIAEKSGWFDETGESLSVDRVMGDFNFLNRTAVEECVKVDGDEMCERMNKIDSCFDKIVYQE